MDQERNEGESNKHLLDQRYIHISKLGKGTYGRVSLARDKLTQELVAIKKIIFHVVYNNAEKGRRISEHCAERDMSDKEHRPLLHRSSVLTQVKIKDIVCGPMKLNIVFEHMKGDLKGRIDDLEKNEYLTKKTVKV